MSLFELYLIMQADSISTLFGFIAVICIAASIPIICMAYDKYEEAFTWKFPAISISVGLVALFVSFAIPSTKSLVTVIGVHQVMNNEQAMQLPDNLLKVMNKYLKEIIDE